MDSSTYQTLIFLFSIAFQHYLGYGMEPLSEGWIVSTSKGVSRE